MSNVQALYRIAREVVSARDYTAPINVACDVADAVIAAGWRPPAQVIGSVEELDALPKCAVVVDRSWSVWQAQPGGMDRRWATIWGSAVGSAARVLANGSVTFVWSPIDNAVTE